MTIRTRLLLLLLPTLTGFVALIAFFFYFNWSQEIMNGFKSRLESVVIATAFSISEQEINWVTQHLNQPDLKNHPQYLAYRHELEDLQRQLALMNLYIVRIEPIQNRDSPPNSSSAYQQVFLVDAGYGSEGPFYNPGDIDFSETDEHQIYFSKKAFVTPIYEAQKTQERLMSAYAPIFNTQGDVIALLGADVSVKEIDQKLDKALLIILLGTGATILLVMSSVFLIADRISQPVQQLNQAALEIAAGHYEANVAVQGPREIQELANTLNTMSECLVENMSRLKEASLVRERLYGEYECALLLQHYMMQKTIENFQHPYLDIRYATVPGASHDRKGALVRFDSSLPSFKILFIESPQAGFNALYNLIQTSYLPLKNQSDLSYVECEWSSDYRHLSYRYHQTFPPLIWSIQSQKFVSPVSNFSLNQGDMIFICGQELMNYFERQEAFENWLGRILRHFAEEGLETIHLMISNELNFLTKREHLRNTFHILSLQVKSL